MFRQRGAWQRIAIELGRRVRARGAFRVADQWVQGEAPCGSTTGARRGVGLCLVLLLLTAAMSGGQCASRPAAEADPEPEPTRPPMPASLKGRELSLFVLPRSFSKNSRQRYSDWISHLKERGYGNALWQEMEDILYPNFEITVPPKVKEQRFRRVLVANKHPDQLDVALPDRVLTINTNFFVRKSEKLSGLDVDKKRQFHTTVYLRYYKLDAGAINQPIPATGRAVKADLLNAQRAAAEQATRSLLNRLARAESGP